MSVQQPSGRRHRAAQLLGGLATLSAPHLHWFRRVGDDPYSSAGLYACRCGVVRPAP